MEWNKIQRVCRKNSLPLDKHKEICYKVVVKRIKKKEKLHNNIDFIDFKISLQWSHDSKM